MNLYRIMTVAGHRLTVEASDIATASSNNQITSGIRSIELVGTVVERIDTLRQLRRLARDLGVRSDWHEPDEQELTARVEGKSFDNAGFWPADDTRIFDADILELHVILSVDNEDVAAINLATLLSWAAREGD